MSAIHFRHQIAPIAEPDWGPEIFIATLFASAFFLILAFATGHTRYRPRTPNQVMLRMCLASGFLTCWLIYGYSFDMEADIITVYPPCPRLPSGAPICREYHMHQGLFLLISLFPLWILTGIWFCQRRYGKKINSKPPVI